jgi:hypothetical protein
MREYVGPLRCSRRLAATEAKTASSCKLRLWASLVQSTPFNPLGAAIWQIRSAVAIIPETGIAEIGNDRVTDDMAMDSTTRTELEAAVFRRLVEHLRTRTDVQNIDLMNLAGFCRNCLSNWLKEAADAKGLPLSKDESREAIYGMPYEEWKARHQSEASPEQMAAMKKVHPGH